MVNLTQGLFFTTWLQSLHRTVYLPPQAPHVVHRAPNWTILTDCFVWCGQRVRVGFAPAHGEDVHGLHVDNELWTRSLQTCIGRVKTTGTDFTTETRKKRAKHKHPRDEDHTPRAGQPSRVWWQIPAPEIPNSRSTRGANKVEIQKIQASSYCAWAGARGGGRKTGRENKSAPFLKVPLKRRKRARAGVGTTAHVCKPPRHTSSDTKQRSTFN